MPSSWSSCASFGLRGWLGGTVLSGRSRRTAELREQRVVLVGPRHPAFARGAQAGGGVPAVLRSVAQFAGGLVQRAEHGRGVGVLVLVRRHIGAVGGAADQ